MRQIVLLRGINIGPNKRVAMPRLREVLDGGGYEDVSTYVQSGNVVLSSDAEAQELARGVESLIETEFGFTVDVVVRTRDELSEVVRRDPLGDVAADPRRYQVTFLSAEPDPDVVEKLAGLATESERFVALGRELYAWHPDGVARSRLWTKLAGQGLGVTATSRNWNTVLQLLEMADG
ncbi:MAG: hypothetical protein QOJ97_665 [Solirubrobacteraceae bacterium]|nr:hypothetical protein [Solirubrobacteraceae bacterium]